MMTTLGAGDAGVASGVVAAEVASIGETARSSGVTYEVGRRVNTLRREGSCYPRLRGGHFIGRAHEGAPRAARRPLQQLPGGDHRERREQDEPRFGGGAKARLPVRRRDTDRRR